MDLVCCAFSIPCLLENRVLENVLLRAPLFREMSLELNLISSAQTDIEQDTSY